MDDTTPSRITLEAALDALTRALAACRRGDESAAGEALAVLKDLHRRFDPRRDRVSAALCLAGVKLLEEVRARGSVGPRAATRAVDELALGLRETLLAGAHGATSTSCAALGSTLSPPAGEQTTRLRLSIESLENQHLGELMVKLGTLTPEQVEHVLSVQAEGWRQRKLFCELAIELGYTDVATVQSALRLQARGRGQPPPPEVELDPWGRTSS